MDVDGNVFRKPDCIAKEPHDYSITFFLLWSNVLRRAWWQLTVRWTESLDLRNLQVGHRRAILWVFSYTTGACCFWGWWFCLHDNDIIKSPNTADDGLLFWTGLYVKRKSDSPSWKRYSEARPPWCRISLYSNILFSVMGLLCKPVALGERSCNRSNHITLSSLITLVLQNSCSNIH